MPVPAIILAAGASRRLGQPKQLVQIDDETLLSRTIRIALESIADPIFVVLGANAGKIQELVDMRRVHVFINQDWEQGIASSIHIGVESLVQRVPDISALMILVCDQPKLTSNHLQALVEAYKQHGGTCIVASQYGNVIGIPAIFPQSQFANLLKLQGDSGARHLLRDPSCSVIALPFYGGEEDIDTPVDLAALQKRMENES